MELNNREIATLLWVAAAFIGAVLHRTTREGLLDVTKIFFSRQIMTVVGLLLTYVIAQVWILRLAGIWDCGQLKNTVIWSIAVAFVALFRIPNISDNAHFFRDWIKDNLKLIVLLEFFVSFYTFSLMIELIIIPVVTFAVAAVAVGERDPKLKPATDLFQGLLGAFGMFLIGFGIY
ncbi:MAG: hypothetical protein IH587_05790, partial [Anaerolineae bacterium]|nr:hypothetical protein [Anaerolineae bacterium]